MSEPEVTKESKASIPVPVNLIAQTPVNCEVIRAKGGVVPTYFKKHPGGARVERGARTTVMSDVAERLIALKHESYEVGREGQFIPSFTREM